MLKTPINRNADAPGQGGEAPKSVGFSALSDIETIENEINSNSQNADELAASSKKEDEITDARQEVVEEVNQAASGEKKDDPSGAEAKATAVDNKPAEDASDEEITEFKVPGSEIKKDNESTEDADRKKVLDELAEKPSWQVLAKATYGLDIKEDTFEAYETGIKAFHEQDKASAVEAARKEAQDLDLSKKPIEAVAIIKGLEEGFTIDELIAPKVAIEKLESLSNAELIAEDCRLKGWDQELIDKHIADLTEKDRLDVAAQPLRDVLKTNKENLAQKQVDQLQALKLSREATENQARIKESEEIKSTLVNMKTYMGLPIKPEVVDHIVKKWNSGEYHEAFKTSDKVAKFLMFDEFGEQGLKALANREYQRGRDDKARKLHNIPPVQQAGGKAANQQAVKAEGNFAALD